VWLKGNAHEKFALSHAQGRISQISAMEPQHRAFWVMGDRRARDDKPTAQTTRCCIFGGLSHHHRKCRNRYIDSSKTGTDPAVTVARGAPALNRSSGVAVRETVIVALGCFLIGTMAAVLMFLFVP
jgi:hypothetical protein